MKLLDELNILFVFPKFPELNTPGFSTDPIKAINILEKEHKNKAEFNEK